MKTHLYLVKKKGDCTYDMMLVCIGEDLLQQLGPEIVEQLLQVDLGALIVEPQIFVQVREEPGILRVYRT